MRLCLMSDTHNLHGTLRNLRKSDVLVHAGDFTNLGKFREILAFNRWLGDVKEKVGYKHIVVVPGNHDGAFDTDPGVAESSMTNATVLNRKATEIEGLIFYGEPRTHEYGNWWFGLDHTGMRRAWEIAPDKVDVLVTHGPPAGVLDANESGERCGCPHLRDWILEHRPRLVVCGHIHPSYGSAMLGETRVVNAALMGKPLKRPIYIDL